MRTQNPKGGRPKKAGEKRDQRVVIRSTPTEKTNIERNAAGAGMSVSDFCRSRSLGFRPVATSVRMADPALISSLNALVVQLKRDLNNINQLARATHRDSAFQEYWHEIGKEQRALIDKASRVLDEALSQ